VFHVTLEHGRSLTVLFTVAATAVFLTTWFYRGSGRELKRGLRRLLLTLRITSVLLVVLLLFRPVFSLETELQSKRLVVLLLDNSASMSVADDSAGSSRFNQARARVADWYARLKQDFDVRLFAFSGQAVPVASVEELALVEPRGESTSLVRALQAGSQAGPRRDIEAMLLLSDGVQTAAGDPVQTARTLGVVVHTVGVGNSLRDSPSYRDVQVSGIECPPELVLNNRARITARIESVGLTGRVVPVMLEEDGKVLDQTELTLAGTGVGQEVAFGFLPVTKGRHTYVVRVPVLPEEKIPQNNQRSASAQVVEARIRVLFLEGALRAEYGALVDRFLSKDPDIEFCALVQTRRNVFAQRSNISGLKLTTIPSDPAVLEKFNVFILGDLDASFLKPAQMELLARRVRDGAGLVMLGGYNSLGAGGYAGTPVGDILPVELGSRDIAQVTDTFLPLLTPAGRAHPIFTGIARFFPTKAAGPQVPGLPPLDGCARVAGARPGATVLAVCPGEAAMPVLAVQPVGKGRTGVFTGDTTRNWQQGPRALDQESPFLRFWGQTIRWLAGRTDNVRADASVIARSDRAWYEPDAPVLISAVVRDKEGEGAGTAQVTARIKKPFGQDDTVPLPAVAGPSGNYHASYEPKRPGKYEITVEAKVGGSNLAAEKLIVEVGSANLEFDHLDLDEKTLSRIAEAGGGRYAHLSTADRVIEDLDRRAQRRRVYLEGRLYWPPLFWVLIVGLLATEWGLRKRNQLR
jgi:uncharacterized membrane protein